MMYNNNIFIREDRAITMIALVVTIIILLILAGITMIITLGDNGIINRTKKAKETYEMSEENEYVAMNQFDDGINEQSNAENRLVDLFKNGTIKIGDYINYTVPSTGRFTTNAKGDDTSNGFANQTYDVNNNGETINWRVLGLGDNYGNLTLNSNNGTNILIISGSPVQKNININSENEYDRNPYLYMGKAESYINANNILNSISRIYINDDLANNARSINDKDINTLLSIEVNYDTSKVYKKNDENNNIDSIRTMGNVYTFSEDDYSANSYNSGKKSAISYGEESVKGTGYSYWIDSFKNKSIGNTIVGDLILNQTDMNSNFAKSYWLASTGIEVSHSATYCIGQVHMGSVNLGSGVFYSNGNWYVFGLGVYPIISLKSELTDQDLKVVSGTEKDWSYKPNLYYTGNINNYETNGTKRNMF